MPSFRLLYAPMRIIYTVLKGFDKIDVPQNVMVSVLVLLLI